MKIETVNKNPELTRNIWLELSTNRLIILPAIISAIVFLIYIISHDFDKFIKALNMASLIFTSFLVNLWGTKIASESVIDEVNNRTWDSQKLTLISPWDMTLGKLFGSTVYAWYGGIVCMLFFLFSIFFLDNFFLNIKQLLILILGSILSHAVTITLTLFGIRKNRLKLKINSTFYFFLGLFVTSNLTTFTYMGMFASDSYEGLFSKGGGILKWFIIEYNSFDFVLISLIIFTAWSIFGLFRNMKTEFNYVNGPWAWVVFTVFTMIYFAGLAPNFEINKHSTVDLVVIGFVLAYYIILGFTYFLVFIEKKDIIDFRNLIDMFREKEINKLLSSSPIWLLSLPLAAITGIAFTVFNIFFKSGDSDIFAEFPYLLPLNMLFFLLRDIGIVVWLNLSSKFKKPDFTALVFLFLLYAIIPGMVSIPEPSVLTPVFFPFVKSNLINGTLAPLVQFLFVFYFTYKKYLKEKNKLLLKLNQI